ncbi:hypothetical protein [Synergistes jonesii]|uniref:hypothetical protein n=1 Tax=Synergistes jonesii TaxID=2754 RepID=UPI00248DADA7|nr:hypothetical protein [Synergistes jonesii]
MKKIKIYHSAYGEKDVQISESEEIRVDLSSLEEFYSALGERQMRCFRKFVGFWDGGGRERLLAPQAVVKILPHEIISNEFKEAPELIDKGEKAALVVWTIGKALESEAGDMTSSAGSIMTGLLLDVAGSIALYSMHAELIGWIKKNIGAPAGKYICGEYYPGIGRMRQDLMEKVVALGETERLMGVTASGTSLLHPRKSQCAFLALGAKEGECSVKTEPCSPCNGKKCLYYQLGGCHMPPEWQKAKRK